MVREPHTARPCRKTADGYHPREHGGWQNPATRCLPGSAVAIHPSSNGGDGTLMDHMTSCLSFLCCHTCWPSTPWEQSTSSGRSASKHCFLPIGWCSSAIGTCSSPASFPLRILLILLLTLPQYLGLQESGVPSWKNTAGKPLSQESQANPVHTPDRFARPPRTSSSSPHILAVIDS